MSHFSPRGPTRSLGRWRTSSRRFSEGAARSSILISSPPFSSSRRSSQTSSTPLLRERRRGHWCSRRRLEGGPNRTAARGGARLEITHCLAFDSLRRDGKEGPRVPSCSEHVRAREAARHCSIETRARALRARGQAPAQDEEQSSARRLPRACFARKGALLEPVRGPNRAARHKQTV